MKVRTPSVSDRRGDRQSLQSRQGRRSSPRGTLLGDLLWNDGMQLSASANETSASSPAMPMQVLRGFAVSTGIGIGPFVVLDRRGLPMPSRDIPATAVGSELERLDRALEEARTAASKDAADARARLGPQYADILSAHCRMISDFTLRRDARRMIGEDLISAEYAVLGVLEGHVQSLERLAGSHLSARAADVRDIEARIISHLTGTSPLSVHNQLAGATVILAHDLSPSEAAQLDPQKVLGFATEGGGRASHTAIVAAALEIPAVVGLGPFLDRAAHCRMAIIDGDAGLLILDPDAETQDRYRKISVERSARFQFLTQQVDLPAETLDGQTVELWGNIEFRGEVEACLDRGAVGVGLFRTEFLFLASQAPPSEDQQFESYKAVVSSMRGRPILIRTLDLGADKIAAIRQTQYLDPNPALGLRSLRLSLRSPELFRTQLRAILRASALGDVRILFPLVSTLGEFRRARALLEDAAAELRAEGHTLPARIPLGIMVEVPAAALIADHLAKEVDFFSIGTNDLIQYTLAVDRTNETVADLYNAADPAVLRLIAMVVEAAKSREIDVSVCGTMGGEPLYTMLLLGLGVRQLSMPPHQLPEIKRVIRSIRIETARTVAADALCQQTAQDVVQRLESALQQVLPDSRE